MDGKKICVKELKMITDLREYLPKMNQRMMSCKNATKSLLKYGMADIRHVPNFCSSFVCTTTSAARNESTFEVLLHRCSQMLEATCSWTYSLLVMDVMDDTEASRFRSCWILVSNRILYSTSNINKVYIVPYPWCHRTCMETNTSTTHLERVGRTRALVSFGSERAHCYGATYGHGCASALGFGASGMGFRSANNLNYDGNF